VELRLLWQCSDSLPNILEPIKFNTSYLRVLGMLEIGPLSRLPIFGLVLEFLTLNVFLLHLISNCLFHRGKFGRVDGALI